MRHRVLRMLSKFLSQLISAALKVVVTSLVFTTCVVMLLRSLGIPMPSPHELLREFEGISKLARILS